MVFLPGHSTGHAAYLGKANRIFFPGDDSCFGSLFIGGASSKEEPYGEYATVTGFRNELVKLVARADEYADLFPSYSVVDIGTIFLSYILEACDKVIADPENYDEKTEVNFGGQPFIQYNKMIYSSGYLSYTMSSVCSSMNYIGMDIGQLIGPVIAGPVAEAFGYATMWRVMVTPLLVAIMIIFFARRRIDGIERTFIADADGLDI